jgi:hypothetical protein
VQVNGGDLYLNAGLTNEIPSNSNNSSNGQVWVQNGGSLTLSQLSNSGSIVGQTGTSISLGTTVTLAPTSTITADSLNLNSNSLTLEISGPAPGAGLPKITANSVALGGQVNVALLGSFLPNLQEQFTFVNSASPISGTVTGPRTINAGPYVFQVNVNTYAAILTVLAVPPTVNVADPGGTYNGQPFPAMATVAGNNGVFSTSLEAVTPTLGYYSSAGTMLAGAPSAAGTYTVVASFVGSTDYSPASASTTFVISPATPTINITATGGTYNGQPYAATATVVGVVTGVDDTPSSTLEGYPVTVMYYVGTSASGAGSSVAPTLAGTYTVVASFGGSADYMPASASTTFVIGQAAPTVTISDAGGTYNALPYPATATVAGVVMGVDDTPASSLEDVPVTVLYYAGGTASGSGSPTPPIQAGTYTAVASFAGSADYMAGSASTTFVIDLAAPTITITDAGGTFNGHPFPATAAIAGVNGIPGTSLENVPLTISYYSGNPPTGTGSPTPPSAVGTYTAVASFAGSFDYVAGSASTAFVISAGGKTAPTLVVTDSGGTYTGKSFLAKATVNGAASLEGVTPKLSYYALGNGGSKTLLSGAPVTVGSYEADAYFAGSTHYTSATAFTTFNIIPATPVVAVAGKGGTFNGKVFTATATLAGVAGKVTSLEGVSPIATYYAGGSALAGAPVAAGTYTVVASFAGSADYTSANASAIFTIARAAAKLKLTDRSGVYNGQPFAATATVAGVVLGVDTTPAPSLEGVTPTFSYYMLSANGTKTLLAGAPVTVGRYEADAFFAGSTDYGPVSRSTTFSITKATPVFSNLSSPTISQGTATTLISGTIDLGSLIPTGSVIITVNGASVSAAIQADGSFSAAIPTAALGVGRHTITFSYVGDVDFRAIVGKGALTVIPS